MKNLALLLFLYLACMAQLPAQHTPANCGNLENYYNYSTQELQKLYQQAKKEKNAYCHVQAFLLMLYQKHHKQLWTPIKGQTGPPADLMMFWLKHEAASSDFPANAFLNYYIGKFYLDDYSNWYPRRSAGLSSSWDQPFHRGLLDSASHFFELALKEARQLQKIPASQYPLLIREQADNQNSTWRNYNYIALWQRRAEAKTQFSLYDLLCHWMIYGFLKRHTDEYTGKWSEAYLLSPMQDFLNKDKPCQQLLDKISTQRLKIQSDEEQVSGRPFKAMLLYRNVSQLCYQLWPLDAERHKKFKARDMSAQQLRQWQQIVQQQPGSQALHQGYLSLPDGDDLQSHYLEMALPAVPAGGYLLLVQDCNNRECSDMIYCNFSSLPEARAAVRSGLTPDKKEQASGKQAMQQEEAVKKAKANMLLFTDRKVYTAGDSLHFRGWISGSRANNTDSLTVIASFERDEPVRLIVAYARVLVNRDGGFSGSMHLPANFKGSNYLFIEAFNKRISFPEHVILLDPPAGEKKLCRLESQHKIYRFNDSIRIRGYLSDAAAAAWANRQISYYICRNKLYPWQSWERDKYTADYSNYIYGNCRVDAQGQFEICFKAASKDEYRPEGNEMEAFEPLLGWLYQLHISMPQSNVVLEYSVAALEKSMLTDLQLPYCFVRNSSRRDMSIICANSVGEDLPAKGSIRFYRLKGPGRPVLPRRWRRPDRFVMSKDSALQLFPFEEYEQESNIKTWAVEKLEALFPVNTDSCKTLPAAWLNQLPPGAYRVEMQLTDAQGRSASLGRYLTVYDEQACQWPFPASWLIFLQNWTPEARLQLTASFDSARTWLDAATNDQQKQWLSINGQQVYDSLRLKANVGGSTVFIRENLCHKKNISLPTQKEAGRYCLSIEKRDPAAQKKSLLLQLKRKKGYNKALDVAVWLQTGNSPDLSWKDEKYGKFFPKDAYLIPGEESADYWYNRFYRYTSDLSDDYLRWGWLPFSWSTPYEDDIDYTIVPHKYSNLNYHMPLMEVYNNTLYTVYGNRRSYGGSGPPRRLETLLYLPHLISDKQGRLQLEIVLPEGAEVWELKVGGPGVEGVEIIEEK